MTFICGIISIIVQKKTLCKNKIRAIYFCPNCVNFVLENAPIFSSFFQERRDCPYTNVCHICLAEL